jgi:hypothetical protein
MALTNWLKRWLALQPDACGRNDGSHPIEAAAPEPRMEQMNREADFWAACDWYRGA